MLPTLKKNAEEGNNVNPSAFSNGIAARISVRGVQAGSEGRASAIAPVTALAPMAAARIAGIDR